jgi:DnaJ-class molecular chaperone
MFYHEKKEIVEYIKITKCETCKGRGRLWAMTDKGFELVTCPECKGTGKNRERITIGEENETE